MLKSNSQINPQVQSVYRFFSASYGPLDHFYNIFWGIEGKWKEVAMNRGSWELSWGVFIFQGKVQAFRDSPESIFFLPFFFFF